MVLHFNGDLARDHLFRGNKRVLTLFHPNRVVDFPVRQWRKPLGIESSLDPQLVGGVDDADQINRDLSWRTGQ